VVTICHWKTLRDLFRLAAKKGKMDLKFSEMLFDANYGYVEAEAVDVADA